MVRCLVLQLQEWACSTERLKCGHAVQKDSKVGIQYRKTQKQACSIERGPDPSSLLECTAGPGWSSRSLSLPRSGSLGCCRWRPKCPSGRELWGAHCGRPSEPSGPVCAASAAMPASWRPPAGQDNFLSFDCFLYFSFFTGTSRVFLFFIYRYYYYFSSFSRGDR
jgi:hypothetical protein